MRAGSKRLARVSWARDEQGPVGATGLVIAGDHPPTGTDGAAAHPGRVWQVNAHNGLSPLSQKQSAQSELAGHSDFVHPNTNTELLLLVRLMRWRVVLYASLGNGQLQRIL